MGLRPALKLVERETSHEQGELWSSSTEDYHSLHYCISYPESFKPGLPSSMIERYSRRGDVVLDPFAGRGTTPLEAAINARVPLASDSNPLAIMLSAAKLEPADLSEVALELQRFDLRRPVSINPYRQYFESFYDIDTFREIANLKQLLLGRNDRVGNFIRLIALSLLHGHTSGYFSVYTFPQVSVASKVQRSINDRRRQNPEYRAVIPRILRKTAQVLRDGGLDSIRHAAALGDVRISDARNLSFIPSASVTLTVSAPPRPYSKDSILDLWLKLWFCGIEKEARQELLRSNVVMKSLDQWLEFINEVLIEQARVLKPSGRVVLDLREVEIPSEDRHAAVKLRLDQKVAEMVERELPLFFEVESVLSHAPAEFRHSLKAANSHRDYAGSGSQVESRLLVLRRR